MSKLLATSFVTLALALALPACTPPNPLRARLQTVERAIGAASSGPRYLRYETSSPTGEWSREVVVLDDAYAERRTRDEDGVRYAFGYDREGAWIRVGDGEALADVDPIWSVEARTQGAILGLAFARPDADTEYLGRARSTWELGVHVDGARPVTLSIDATTGTPSGFDSIDALGRIELCDELGFARRAAFAVLAGARCQANDRFGEAGKMLETTLVLDEARAIDPKSAPAWAVPTARRHAPKLEHPVELPIADARRVIVPVAFGDRAPRPFVLDSGAFDVVIEARAARELGVVPTGETPLFVTPPWLHASRLWVGVVDRFRVGALELHGQRVLVADTQQFGDGIGLLGQTFFRKLVVDVDSPKKTLRLHARERFVPDSGATLLTLRGEDAVSVAAEVVGVARGQLILDTGMEDDLVVTDWRMAVRHPRERGADISLGGPDASRSPDYLSHVDGLRLGPFALPPMDVIGRDRDRERAGGGLGLAGMGTMRLFRLAFDARRGVLYAWPGLGYDALRRAGFEVEDQDGRVVVTRVVDAWHLPLKVDDVVTAVRGQRVKTAGDARRAVIAAPGRWLDVEIERRGLTRHPTFEIVPPAL